MLFCNSYMRISHVCHARNRKSVLLYITVPFQKSSPYFRLYHSVSEFQSVFYTLPFHLRSPVRLLDYTVPFQKSSLLHITVPFQNFSSGVSTIFCDLCLIFMFHLRFCNTACDFCNITKQIT